MTKNQLYSELSVMSSSREDRLNYANLVLNNLTLLPKLLDIAFIVNDKTSCRAAWVLEFVCKKNINALIPYFGLFTNNLKSLHLESALRPMSKICYFIASEYNSMLQNNLKDALTSLHKEQITEVCFDWLIGNQKIATKAYAMDVLFLLGKDQVWVHAQLSEILQQDFSSQSAGYKVRAKRILIKLKAAKTNYKQNRNY